MGPQVTVETGENVVEQARQLVETNLSGEEGGGREGEGGWREGGREGGREDGGRRRGRRRGQVNGETIKCKIKRKIG